MKIEKSFCFWPKCEEFSHAVTLEPEFELEFWIAANAFKCYDLINKYRKPTKEEVLLKEENELLKAQLEYCKMFLDSKNKEIIETKRKLIK